MNLATRLSELQKRTIEHRDTLLTEEAAKTAFVMPFLQSLGYDVFNPGEVVPEFTADVGKKKGEKVDYAICKDGKVSILIECKSTLSSLNISHAAQLFRYFSVTDARLAILTNGVTYQFYSDIDLPNRMDNKPFFIFDMDAIKPTDVRTLEKFQKTTFDIAQIVLEAGSLKRHSLMRAELEKEFAEPSDEFVRLMATHMAEKRLTPLVKDEIRKMLVATIATFIRDMVNDRLSSALIATNPEPAPAVGDINQHNEIITTPEELSGFHIVQAIASRLVDPRRVVMRDSKSYCAILLDDNNRKTIARLHFNGQSVKYLGLFLGKDEERHRLSDLTEIYRSSSQLESRLRELDDSIAA